MRFKVDENLHYDVAEALRARGHDALTVHDQQMRGDPDSRLGEVCQAEGRAIVSLDLDFANIRDYPPRDYAGLIVLRLADQSRPYVFAHSWLRARPAGQRGTYRLPLDRGRASSANSER
jgi:predicted nuclease of predicted toxin-antitoxin system